MSGELASVLGRRRQQVDEKGSQFTSEPQPMATADVSWNDVHESQFTPKGRAKVPDIIDVESMPTSLLIPNDEVDNLPPLDQLDAGGAKEAAAEETEAQPEAPSATADQSGAAEEQAPVVPAALPTEEVGRAPPQESSAPCEATNGASQPAPVMAKDLQAANDPRIWNAVVQGDTPALEFLCQDGTLTSGRLMDKHGHSIFWNAVAFQRVNVALWLLEKFPPVQDGEISKTGVNLTEVHARRGDSLLHLCLYLQDFNADASKLFGLIFNGGEGVPDSNARRTLLNKAGQTFMHIAASRLNFFVMRYALTSGRTAEEEMREVLAVQDPAGHRPMDVVILRLKDALGDPPRPGQPPKLPSQGATKLPSWSQFSRWAPSKPLKGETLPANDGEEDEASLFADIILEVEDLDMGCLARLAAHRAVLGANSKTLHKEMRGLQGGAALHVDPAICRSWEVLAAALAYLYSGELLSCKFINDPGQLLQLLALCLKYALPDPLIVFARSALLHVVHTGEGKAISSLQSALPAVETMGLSADERWFLAFNFLSKLRNFDGATQSLLASLSIVEERLFAARRASLQQQQARPAAAAVASPPPQA